MNKRPWIKGVCVHIVLVWSGRILSCGNGRIARSDNAPPPSIPTVFPCALKSHLFVILSTLLISPFLIPLLRLLEYHDQRREQHRPRRCKSIRSKSALSRSLTKRWQFIRTTLDCSPFFVLTGSFSLTPFPSLLQLGAVGNGKSSTLNSIIQEPLFQSGRSVGVSAIVVVVGYQDRTKMDPY